MHNEIVTATIAEFNQLTCQDRFSLALFRETSMRFTAYRERRFVDESSDIVV